MAYLKYRKAVKFLESLNNVPGVNYMNHRESKKIKKYDRSFFVKRLQYLLDLVDNPEKKLKYVHVAGTAGKGSTTCAIHNIIRKTKKTVGSYYSPHTTAHIERIKVNNRYITPNSFANIVESLKKPLTECALKSPYGVPSYFEVFLTIALIYFVQRKCDWVILETGLGGKNDATNVIRNTKFAIITNVNYDHMDILGETLKEIAREKMGIIKKNCTFITTETRPQLLETFSRECERKGAKFIKLQHQDGENRNDLIAKKMGEIFKLKKESIQNAIKNAKLPCRFETIQVSPRVIIDGSHNPVKIQRLVENIKTLKYENLILMFGMVSDKDALQSLKEIAPLAKRIVFTRSLATTSGRKTTSLLKFKNLVKKLKIKARTNYFLDPWQALNYCLSITESKDCLVITGSMYIVGDIRKKWINEEQILSNRRSF